MIGGTLSRYFGLRFLSAVLAVFVGTLVLTAMIDFLELMRRSGDMQDISAFFIAKITLFRVPFITERVLPFTVLVGAMFCYLNLSRRLELVVARAAGISAWQFTAPALLIACLLGVLATAIYNPISAVLREQSARLEGDLFGFDTGFRNATSGFWLRQRNEEGQAVINAKASRQTGHSTRRRVGFSLRPGGTLSRSYRSARAPRLSPADWRLEGARFYVSGVAPTERDLFRLKTALTAGTGRRELRNPRNRSVLEPSLLHRCRGERRPGRLRISVAVLSAAGAAILSYGHGASGRRREPAPLPLRRRAEDRTRRDCRRLLALRPGKDHGRPEQGRNDAPDGRGRHCRRPWAG